MRSLYSLQVGCGVSGSKIVIYTYIGADIGEFCFVRFGLIWFKSPRGPLQSGLVCCVPTPFELVSVLGPLLPLRKLGGNAVSGAAA